MSELVSLTPLRVVDLRQFLYCPRVVYWQSVAPAQRILPRKMSYGLEAQNALELLEERRTLHRYGLAEGTRQTKVHAFSERMGLSGIIDMVIETPGERVPVEWKDTLGGVRKNHRIQVAAYALLLQESPGPEVRRGMVVSIPTGEITLIKVSAPMRSEVEKLVSEIRLMLDEQQFPGPADRMAKCRDCEFLRLCGDRYPAVTQIE